MSEENTTFEDTQTALMELHREMAETPEESTEQASTPSGEQAQAVPAEQPEAPAPEAEAPVEPAEAAPEQGPEPQEEQPVTGFRLADGTEVTPEMAETWRQGALRQDDYTRRTQELARQRQEIQAQQQVYQQREQLQTDILADQDMRELLSEYPQMMRVLVAQHDKTRSILGNTAEIEKLRNQFEAVKDHPEIVEQLASQADRETEQRELQRYRETESSNQWISRVNEMVEMVGKEYEGVNAHEVGRYLVQLARFPADPTADHDGTVSAVARLAEQHFFTDSQGRTQFDDRIVRGEFKRLAQIRDLTAQQEQGRQEQHNQAVDAALANQQETKPPVSPAETTAPSPESDWEKISKLSYAENRQALADAAYGAYQ